MLRRLQVESYVLRIVIESGSVNSMAPNLESDRLNLEAGRSIPQTAGDLRHARCIASNTRRGASAPGGRASGSSDGKTALRLSPPHVPAHIPSRQYIEDCDLLRGRRFRSTTKRSPHDENTSSSTAFTPPPSTCSSTCATPNPPASICQTPAMARAHARAEELGL